MGLHGWSKFAKSSPYVKFIFGFLAALLWVLMLYMFAYHLIKDFHLPSFIMWTLMILFFMPFMFFGGIYEMKEAIREIKEKRKKDGQS